MILYFITFDNKKSYEVIWVEVVTPKGSIVILEGHAPLMTSLIHDKPITMMLIGGKQEMIHIQKGGFLELSGAIITIIV